MDEKPSESDVESGPDGSVDLTTADADAMDVVLSLMPEARLAAVAVARAGHTRGAYPIESSTALAEVVGATERVVVGGHVIDASTIRTYLASGDLPIDGPMELANVVLAALNRCRRHEQLRESLTEFEAALDADPNTGSGRQER